MSWSSSSILHSNRQAASSAAAADGYLVSIFLACTHASLESSTRTSTSFSHQCIMQRKQCLCPRSEEPMCAFRFAAVTVCADPAFLGSKPGLPLLVSSVCHSKALAASLVAAVDGYYICTAICPAWTAAPDPVPDAGTTALRS